MKRILAALLLLTLAAPAVAGWKEFDEAYERGDYATALRELRPLADQGDAAAQYQLSSMYVGGLGVPQSWFEALEWHSRAAAHGTVRYQSNLMYGKGQGVPPDYAVAAKWYRKAAEQGIPEAQIILGWMYLNGKGVPKDEAESVKWERKAAEQGHTLAQSNLGFFYAVGLGVKEDTVRSLMWTYISLQGVEITREGRFFLDLLKKSMSPAQIAEAQKLAREWKPK